MHKLDIALFFPFYNRNVHAGLEASKSFTIFLLSLFNIVMELNNFRIRMPDRDLNNQELLVHILLQNYIKISQLKKQISEK